MGGADSATRLNSTAWASSTCLVHGDKRSTKAISALMISSGEAWQGIGPGASGSPKRRPSTRSARSNSSQSGVPR